MFFLSYNPELKKDYWAGRTECSYCNNQSSFHLMKNTRDIVFFIIPFMTMIDDRFIQCDCCGNNKKLRIWQYNKIRKKSINLLRSGKYPKEMIEEAFNPENVGLWWKIFKIVFSSLLSLLGLFLGIFSMMEATDFWERFAMISFLWGIGSVPLFITLKGSLPDFKKRKAYKEREKFPNMSEESIHVMEKDLKELIEQNKEKIQVLEKKREEIVEKSNHEIKVIQPVSDKQEKNERKFLGGKSLFLGAIFFVVPRSFWKEKNLFDPCLRLAGKRYTSMLIVSICSLILTVLFAVLGIHVYFDESEAAAGIAFLCACTLVLFITFTAINRTFMRRISYSLKMLVLTGNIKYLDQVIDYIGNTKEKYLFFENLVYIVGSRLIVSYNDIVWIYTRTYENNTSTYLGMIDGKSYPAEISDIVIKELCKQNPDIMVGNSPDYSSKYREIVNEFK